MTTPPDKAEILRILDTVTDPEIPVLTVRDLGIIRDILFSDAGVEVVITPTYSGCPAMNMIEIQILAALREAGLAGARVRTVLSPAWTTAWISQEGREKLERFGIAPPREQDDHPPCPRCSDRDTRLLSQFGSTACKSLWQCNACKEPFDYFKCH